MSVQESLETYWMHWNVRNGSLIAYVYINLNLEIRRNLEAI